MPVSDAPAQLTYLASVQAEFTKSLLSTFFESCILNQSYPWGSLKTAIEHNGHDPANHTIFHRVLISIALATAARVSNHYLLTAFCNTDAYDLATARDRLSAQLLQNAIHCISDCGYLATPSYESVCALAYLGALVADTKPYDISSLLYCNIALVQLDALPPLNDTEQDLAVYVALLTSGIWNRGLFTSLLTGRPPLMYAYVIRQ